MTWFQPQLCCGFGFTNDVISAGGVVMCLVWFFDLVVGFGGGICYEWDEEVGLGLGMVVVVVYKQTEWDVVVRGFLLFCFFFNDVFWFYRSDTGTKCIEHSVVYEQVHYI